MTDSPRGFGAFSRRFWLGGAVIVGTAMALLAGGRASRAAADDEAIDQPDRPGLQAFMDRALAMRRRAEGEGDQPYGAVIVQGERIVGQAPSRVVTRRDPTAHAEMEAIRDAARRLGRRDLAGCTMYASSRPCPMCEAAAYWAGITRMIHGADLADAGAPRLGRC